MRNLRTTLILGVALAGAVALSGCATEKYVDTHVGAVAQELDATQENVAANTGQIQAQDGRITIADATARDALARATAAGKLAEGKFLYSMVLSDDGVKFPSNQAALSPEAETRLAQLVDKLRADNKNVYLEIQGHTDNAGSPQYNEKLGEQRAEAVRKYLAKNGVALNRMGTISYGEDSPVAPNNTKQGRAENRRVVVVVLS